MPKQIYQWKKGDDLEKIAKANGLKNGTAIWDSPENKAIVRTRGKPENLKPGDKLSIENMAQKAKQLAAVVESLKTAKFDAEREIDHYQDCIKQNKLVTKRLLDDIEDDRKKFHKAEDTAALIEMATGITGGMAKVGVASVKMASKTEKVVEESGKEALDGLVEMNKAPAEFIQGKIVDKLLDSRSKCIKLAAIIVRDTTDHFWLGVAISRKLNGATWSETARIARR